MPRTPWGAWENPLLSGSFGVFQSEAAARASTQDIWRSLRVNAATWQWQAQGGGELPPPSVLEEQGRRILSEQGVTIQHVNQYRRVAGEWRQARERLDRLGESEQITAGEIWQPPWAQTTGAQAPSRYRVRVQWQIEHPSGELRTMWGSYELESPLTSMSDVVDQARGLAGKKPTSDMPLGSKITDVVDYELEQV